MCKLFLNWKRTSGAFWAVVVVLLRVTFQLTKLFCLAAIVPRIVSVNGLKFEMLSNLYIRYWFLSWIYIQSLCTSHGEYQFGSISMSLHSRGEYPSNLVNFYLLRFFFPIRCLFHWYHYLKILYTILGCSSMQYSLKTFLLSQPCSFLLSIISNHVVCWFPSISW